MTTRRRHRPRDVADLLQFRASTLPPTSRRLATVAELEPGHLTRLRRLVPVS